MTTIVRCGATLGLLVAVYTAIVAAVGAYTNNVLAFWAVLLLQIVGAFWALRKTAPEGRGYLSQVRAGTLVFLVMAVLLFVTTFLTLTFISPDYADVIVDAQRTRIVAEGNPPADLEARLATLHAMYTPIRQASFGVPATVVTGLVFSLFLGLFVRNRTPTL